MCAGEQRLYRGEGWRARDASPGQAPGAAAWDWGPCSGQLPAAKPCSWPPGAAHRGNADAAARPAGDAALREDSARTTAALGATAVGERMSCIAAARHMRYETARGGVQARLRVSTVSVLHVKSRKTVTSRSPPPSSLKPEALHTRILHFLLLQA